MAEKSRPNNSLSEIRQQVDRSRAQLGRDLGGLRYELDIPSRVRNSFRSKTVVWITAAAAVGLVLTVLPSRNKRVSVKAKGQGQGKETLLASGLLLSGLKIAVNLLKPVIVSFAAQQMKEFASRSSGKW